MFWICVSTESPVPAGLDNFVAQNQFVHFEYLWLANSIACWPTTDITPVSSRIPSFKLAQIQFLDTSCRLGSLYFCNWKDKSCSFIRSIQYFDHVWVCHWTWFRLANMIFIFIRVQLPRLMTGTFRTLLFRFSTIKSRIMFRGTLAQCPPFLVKKDVTSA